MLITKILYSYNTVVGILLFFFLIMVNTSKLTSDDKEKLFRKIYINVSQSCHIPHKKNSEILK
jgi:hypothetical protein